MVFSTGASSSFNRSTIARTSGSRLPWPFGTAITKNPFERRGAIGAPVNIWNMSMPPSRRCWAKVLVPVMRPCCR